MKSTNFHIQLTRFCCSSQKLNSSLEILSRKYILRTVVLSEKVLGGLEKLAIEVLPMKQVLVLKYPPIATETGVDIQLFESRKRSVRIALLPTLH